MKRMPQQHNACMPSITVRDVPEETRKELAARAARSGQSMQEYLRRLLVDTAQEVDIDEVIAEARERVVRLKTRMPAREILAARDSGRRRG